MQKYYGSGGFKKLQCLEKIYMYIYVLSKRLNKLNHQIYALINQVDWYHLGITQLYVCLDYFYFTDVFLAILLF